MHFTQVHEEKYHLLKESELERYASRTVFTALYPGQPGELAPQLSETGAAPRF